MDTNSLLGLHAVVRTQIKSPIFILIIFCWLESIFQLIFIRCTKNIIYSLDCMASIQPTSAIGQSTKTSFSWWLHIFKWRIWWPIIQIGESKMTEDLKIFRAKKCELIDIQVDRGLIGMSAIICVHIYIYNRPLNPFDLWNKTNMCEHHIIGVEHLFIWWIFDDLFFMLVF